MLALLVNAQLIIFWLFIYYIGINSIEFCGEPEVKTTNIRSNPCFSRLLYYYY